MLCACRLRDSAGINSTAHRHRLAYTAANILGRRRRGEDERARRWSVSKTLAAGWLAVACVFGLAAAAVLAFVPEARKTLGIFGAAATSEV